MSKQLKCEKCNDGKPGKGCRFYEQDQAGDASWRDEGGYETEVVECQDGCGCIVGKMSDLDWKENDGE